MIRFSIDVVADDNVRLIEEAIEVAGKHGGSIKAFTLRDNGVEITFEAPTQVAGKALVLEVWGIESSADEKSYDLPEELTLNAYEFSMQEGGDIDDQPLYFSVNDEPLAIGQAILTKMREFN